MLHHKKVSCVINKSQKPVFNAHIVSQYVHVCSTVPTITPHLYWFWYTFYRIMQKRISTYANNFINWIILGSICRSEIINTKSRNPLCFWCILPICFLSYKCVPIYNHFGSIRNCCLGTSLVVQWLRILLTMQGTRVWSLVWEDPTCRGETKPVCHDYWAHVLQLLKPACLEPTLRNKRSHRNEKPAHRNEEYPPLTATRESPCNEDPMQTKK